jgi:hypothetical protein
MQFTIQNYQRLATLIYSRKPELIATVVILTLIFIGIYMGNDKLYYGIDGNNFRAIITSLRVGNYSIFNDNIDYL